MGLDGFFCGFFLEVVFFEKGNLVFGLLESFFFFWRGGVLDGFFFEVVFFWKGSFWGGEADFGAAFKTGLKLVNIDALFICSRIFSWLSFADKLSHYKHGDFHLKT